MTAVWQVQEAKNRFSEVIERALHEGPQTVTRHGKPVVRVVAVSGAPVPAALPMSDTQPLQAALKKWRGMGVAGQSTDEIMRETRGEDWNRA